MIQVHDIRISHAQPGRYAAWMVDIRFIDLAKGTHVNDLGMELWNYDKAVTIEGWYLGSLLKKAGRIITEVLCRD
jgi:hypothetical protein